MKRFLIPVLLIGMFVIVILMMPGYIDDSSYLSVPRYLGSILRGDIYNTDLGQEYFGFQGLLTNQDAYPFIVTCRSTHPPTAFLFAAPIAPIHWPEAAVVWAWLSLAVIGISLYIMDFSPIFVVSVTLLLAFWTPVAFSLGQITPIWLLGLCLAYRERNRNAFLAGVWIGIASLTKYLPVLLLVPFLIRKKWSAVLGFGLVWISAIGIILALSPAAIWRYFEVNNSVFAHLFEPSPNASFLITFYNLLGMPGFMMVGAIIAVIFTLNWREYTQGEISRESWHFFSFLSVALLPIAWPHSITPLLPGMIDLALSKRPSRMFAFFAFLLPFFFPPGAYRHILIPSLFLFMLGFIPIHELLNRKQAGSEVVTAS